MASQASLTQPEVKFYTIKELADALKTSRMLINGALLKGDIAGIRVGDLWRIPAAEYERILQHGLTRKEETP